MPSNVKEYTISLDDYNNPEILKGADAISLFLLRLFIMNPGEIETHPDMGIGFAKNYKYMDLDDIPKLKLHAEKQIETYLPLFQNVVVNIEKSKTIKGVLLIEIKIDNTIYSLLGTNEGVISLSDIEHN